MNKITSNLLALVIAILSCLQFSMAQAPSMINYQAVARNTSGALIANQNISVQISILDGSITGTTIYVEHQNATTNQFGLFTIQIGAGTSTTGTFSTINWATGSKFIKTEFDPSGGTAYANMGTSQLLSVPYALYAASGGTPDNWGTQSIVTDTMFTGNGTVASPITLAKHRAISGQFLKWNGTTWLPSSISVANYWTKSGNNLYNNTGFKVGIGTSAAAAQLEVNGHGIIDSSLVVDYANSDTGSLASGLKFGMSSGEGIASNRGFAGSQPNINGLDFYTAFAKRMTIASNGFVGIGTTAPAAQLDINSNQSANGINIQDVGSNTSIYASKSGYNLGSQFLKTSTSSTSAAVYISCVNDIGVYAVTNNPNSYAGYFSGNVYTTGSYLPSDERLKNNIHTYDNAISTLNKLDVKQYNYRNDGLYAKMNLPQGNQIGIMAQNIQNVLPNLVKNTTVTANTLNGVNSEAPSETIEFNAVNYTGLIPVLVKGMQEQQAQIEELKKQNAELMSKMNDLLKK